MDSSCRKRIPYDNRHSRHDARRRRARRRRKGYVIRLARAYRKAPMTVRIQVTVFLIVIVAGVAGLITGGVVFVSWLSDGGSKSYYKGSTVLDQQDTDSGTIYVYRARVNERVRGYEDIIYDYCKRYKIGKYSELALAIMQQESDGFGPDVMQSSECGYNREPPIDTPEESINCGIQYLRDCLRLARVRGPADIERISLAIQGYNFGAGYIRVHRDGEGYTRDNATIFSEDMKQRLNTSVYGDPQYVPHVLRYYKRTKKISKTGHDSE